nr:nadh-ubiquinone oxidoreductase assembly factor n7bml [Quercus suber]
MTAPSSPGFVRQLWFRWKALKLPWRRQFLVGADLMGNTFWEFKDALNSNRLRRIVKYSSGGFRGRRMDYADVKISPQWHQWLRHTRDPPPTIQEQQYEVSRQANMRQLAAKADERWKSIPSYLDAPKTKQQPRPATEVKDPGGFAPSTEPENAQGVMSAVESQDNVARALGGEQVDEGRFRGQEIEKKREQNPWKTPQRGAPSENWQPQEWSPGAVQRR